MSDQRPTTDQRNHATFAALTMVLAIVFGFVVLVAFVIPNLLLFVIVPAGFGLMMVLQYLIWGRWLTKSLQEQQPPESVDSKLSGTSQTP